MRAIIAAGAILAALPAAQAGEALPLNPVVTVETQDATICAPGWTRTIRPGLATTRPIKLALLAAIGETEAGRSRYQLDHRIPLSLGGAVDDPVNFQLQPWPEAARKDRVESCLRAAVCAGKIALSEAQARIWRDWRDAGAWCEGPAP